MRCETGLRAAGGQGYEDTTPFLDGLRADGWEILSNKLLILADRRFIVFFYAEKVHYA